MRRGKTLPKNNPDHIHIKKRKEKKRGNAVGRQVVSQLSSAHGRRVMVGRGGDS